MSDDSNISKLSEDVIILRQRVEDISKANQQEAREVDFKLYLESVSTSSQRSRSILYVIIIALISTFCAIRQTELPDWQSARLSKIRTAYDDITGQSKSLLNVTREQLQKQPADFDALGYASRMLRYDPDDPSRHAIDDGFTFLEKVKPFIAAKNDGVEGPVEQLRYYLDEFRKLVLEGRVLNLPVIGIRIDGNDLALIAGTVFTALLYLLSSSFRRERINLNAARLRAEERDPANLQLLLMAQVLSPAFMSPKPFAKPPKFMRIEKIFANIPLLATIVLPGLLTGFSCWRDYKDRQILFVLEEGWEGKVDLALQFVFTALVLGLVVLTIVQFRRLNIELSELENSANAKQNSTPPVTSL